MKVGITHNYPLSQKHGVMVKEIEKVLKEEGYEVILIPVSENFLEKIKDVDMIFNLHTYGKETRQVLIPSLCDILEIPYTGSNAYVHAICLNKTFTKIILQYYKIPTPNFFLVYPEEDIPESINLSFPLFVKPNREGNGQGIRKESLVRNMKELKEATYFIHKEFREEALVEEFIEGKEISVGFIGNNEDFEILPLLEIDFSELPQGIERFYSEKVKEEFDENTRYFCPARLSEKIEKEIKDITIRIFKYFNLRDYARIDIRVRDDKIYVLDVNSLPLLIPNYSAIIKMAEARGYSYKDLMLKILDSARKRAE
ncbi:MAG TPA: ATP-grasp domain-containing protein [Dictyoglomaceae bacterium]|nr:ATP-grasp domain-containing protein [Dictyoglomaceae bacterium]HPU42959.1 ATP-grasp domain-containing protein [Dictyoglomaceae bacterium]